MNCTNVRAALPGMLYEELPPEEATALRDHLAGCAGCRQELTALQRLKGALNTLPAPAVSVDLSKLYQEASRRQERRLRRWRRTALACCGVAAAVLVALALKLEVRVDGHQVVVRWGTPPAVVLPHEQRPAATLPSGPAAASAEELQLVKKLIHVLADDVAARDRQHQEAIVWLQGRLDDLQRQAQDRWDATERYVSALYTINTNLTQKE